MNVLALECCRLKYILKLLKGKRANEEIHPLTPTCNTISTAMNSTTAAAHTASVTTAALGAERVLGAVCRAPHSAMRRLPATKEFMHSPKGNN